MTTPNRYVIGSVITLRDIVTDPNNANAPVTGATVTCTVWLPPDKTTTASPSVTEVGGGIYQAEFVPTVAGFHDYLFSVPQGQNGAGAPNEVPRFWVAPTP